MSIGQARCKHLNDLINKRLNCKDKKEKQKLDKQIINTKHHVSNLLTIKQALLLLKLVDKYDLKPLMKSSNKKSKKYFYQLYLLDFEIKSIADDVIIPRNKKHDKFDENLVMASHSANTALGSSIDDNSKTLKSNILYTYHNSVLNIATIEDIQKGLKATEKVLSKELKK